MPNASDPLCLPPPALLCLLTPLPCRYGNFFQHEEDYRWPIIRGKMHPVVFLLFNLSFIASYQNILLWWIAMPAYEVAQGNTDLQIKDIM